MTQNAEIEQPGPGGGIAPDQAAAQAGLRGRRRTLSAGAFLGVVAAVFAAAFAATLALPHDPYIRYQGFRDTMFARLEWVYERLAFSPTPIDVLVVGSSRSARGINAAAIEDALAQRGLGDLHVANISVPAAGLDIRDTQIREALAHHPEIRLIVYGLSEALPRDGHQAFGDLAPAGEILAAPLVVNRTWPANLMGLPYRQMELALATALPEAFGRRGDYDPGAFAGPTPDHRRFTDPDWSLEAENARLATAEHEDALARESRRRRREITPPLLPEALAGLEFGVSRHYVRAAAALAEEAGAAIVFTFLPFYQGYAAPIDQEWLERLGPVRIADFLRQDARNYVDAAHASQNGMDLITPWIAGIIAAELETPR